MSRSHRGPSKRASFVAILALVIGASAFVGAPAATAAGSLLSQGKPTTASSVENAGTLAPSATDGNTGTRWSSAYADPQWLQVDLGQSATIDQVILNWEGAYGTAFKIEASPDGTAGSWTALSGGTVTNGTGGIQTLAVSGTGRFVRMYGTARNSGWGYSLWEFQVFGTIGAPPPPPTCGTTNVALNGPSTASSVQPGNPAANAFDGNVAGTRWASLSADPQWVQVDLGSSQTICKVVLNWEAAYGKTFKIEVSPDANANSWTALTGGTVINGTGGIQTLAVSGTGRFVRMYGTAPAAAAAELDRDLARRLHRQRGHQPVGRQLDHPHRHAISRWRSQLGHR